VTPSGIWLALAAWGAFAEDIAIRKPKDVEIEIIE
jgi:hypothetical protein